MRNKLGFLVDIDNTLYSYNLAHQPAMEAVANYFLQKTGISKEVFFEKYKFFKNQTNINLHGTASSHNRLIYFKNIVEEFKLKPISIALALEDLYWSTFISNIILFEGVTEFFFKYGKDVCFLTDLTLNIQLKKLLNMGLIDFVDKIVTSEEIGSEKPSKEMFSSGIVKLGNDYNKIIMIGDNFERDIVGARKFGINSIWLNSNKEEGTFHDNSIKVVYTFSDILKVLNE